MRIKKSEVQYINATWPEKAKSIVALIKDCDGSHEEIDNTLEAINEVLSGFGVEAINDNDFYGYYADISLLYVNMGDTYTPTIIYDTRNDEFLACSWGDVVEMAQ